MTARVVFRRASIRINFRHFNNVFVDMLTVDGPPQTSDSEVLARYPALPAFAGQLSKEAAIFVDDAKRVTEQEMIRKWLQVFPEWKSKMIDTIPGTCVLERQT